MADLIKRRERMRVLVTLALALGSTSATVGGMLATFAYAGHSYTHAASDRVA